MIRIPLPVKMPRIIKWMYPHYLWDKKKACKGERVLYLTFDDGPIPEVTPWVLSLLKDYNAKATFFMIGENIEKHPEVFGEVLRTGHRLGNHTYNHLNGYKTSTSIYLENVAKTAEKLEKNCRNHTSKASYSKNNLLFRPPYGKIRKKQARSLRKEGYEIVLYDTLAYDWDQKINGDTCSENVLKNAENGSIILFHDSFKAFNNLQVALPQILEYFSVQGFRFRAL